ncbi:sugar ABC transporter, ATP-binding protein [Deferribacter desulfuricans SSM1]|uniref:Sugar ABC transporter, ATP-binding protein n=1 Tax=Deferribacter desulfuricans (strain DSM 14783 / JCM 11476 / NBRC 101012 / SSM1) TaxID=639282 RepID=D3PCX6_DEFDS|nr:ABC transporter ATP-binding protein [Deferribacter desulfuricans]BAI80449.1 sugar ABC transporter, ATP-binding protein [Deferribacter desulfuricans SSM1]
MAEVLLSLKNITKSFGNVIANNNVTFDIEKGEIHTLLGENGAGKSTLMNIITGLYKPDSGEILWKGKQVEINSPMDALKLGIGMVHQHFMLVRNHTVYENLFLSVDKPPFLLKKQDILDKINGIIEKFDLNISLNDPVWKLEIGKQQWIEIIKLLLRDCELFILDEPTAVLTPQESQKLFEFLKGLRDSGKSIIFISHKMKEVMDISDKVTVLKKGEVVKTLKRGDFDEKILANLMIDRDEEITFERKLLKEKKVILSLKDLYVRNEKGLSDLDGLSLDIYKGEVFGIAGVAGNGQKALAEVLTGLKKVERGQILINGQDMTYSGARSKYIAGIAHIPEDRKTMGIAPDMSVEENLVLKNYKDKQFRKGIFLNFKKIRENAIKKVEDFDIRLASLDQSVRFLSGGNIQKVIIARELSQHPQILVALYPTRGLDVGSAEYVHKVILEERDKGVTTILISEDLDELLRLSDRIGVIFRGKIIGIVEPSKTTITEIGLLMAGHKNEN